LGEGEEVGVGAGVGVGVRVRVGEGEGAGAGAGEEVGVGIWIWIWIGIGIGMGMGSGEGWSTRLFSVSTDEERRGLAAEVLGVGQEEVSVSRVWAAMGQVGGGSGAEGSVRKRGGRRGGRRGGGPREGVGVECVECVECVEVEGVSVSVEECSGEDAPLAVMKVYAAGVGEEELKAEKYGLEWLCEHRLPGHEPVGVLRVGVTEEGAGVLLMTGARGRTVDSLMVGLAREEVSLEAVEEACGKVGEVLGHLHRVTATEDALPEERVRWLVESARANMRMLESQRGAYASLESLDVEGAGERVEELSREVRENVGKGRGSANHGDYHPGNLFYNAASGSTTLIDCSGLRGSVGAEGQGISSPAIDLGKFVSTLRIFGGQYGLIEPQLRALQAAFERGYGASVGPSLCTSSEVRLQRCSQAARRLSLALIQARHAGRIPAAVAEFRAAFNP
jgi:aminoglycoside phosphotransferase (APT) family kinase protein